ncbi:glycosyltransferase [Actinoallomurus acanthiterrae]
MSVVTTVALVGWIHLAVGRGGFWLTESGPPDGPAPAEWPEVVAVVPARDEAEVLPQTLPSLLTQRYPGRFRVVLVDDDSRDGTAAVAERIGRTSGSAELRVVRASGPPTGWAGKVWALAQGVRAAGEPEYLLFTDADIAYAPGTLARLVATALDEDRDLVSLMATLRTRTGWERTIVPAFVYFFAQLYPFRRVRRPTARTAAAAGGCILVRRSALAGAGGLDAIRGALIDDVALGRLVKRHGGRCRLDMSRQVVSRRPYPRLADLWSMIARTAYTQLRYSPPLLAATVLGLMVLYAAPPVGAMIGAVGVGLGLKVPATMATGTGLLAWAIMAVTYVPTLRFYRMSALRALMLPLVAMIYLGMTLDSARRYHTGRGGAWKRRTVGEYRRAGPAVGGSGPSAGTSSSTAGRRRRA